jgi:hypothetical protein
LEEALNIDIPDTYVTPSITIVLIPVWAKAAPTNNKEITQLAILKKV